MKQPAPTSLASGSWPWPVNRRLLVLVSAVAVLTAGTAVLGWLTTSTGTEPSSADPVSSPSPVSTGESAAPGPSAGNGGVAPPPSVSDPLAFGAAAAEVLWSYDTRTASRAEHLAGLEVWMTAEEEWADFDAVAAQVPDPLLWSRMADQGQHATATAEDARYPHAFTAALAEDPAALAETHIYAVTVTGHQSIAWSGGGAGAEDRAITLAVQCRPDTDCALVSIAPRVAP
ncbi:hypothetical protein [Streptomyces sp. YIM 98790]|uniref:hypothetical protein n=1 Tax=Streptomyces sp. YIM 98790 TaxID=2689077 RepID=UPI00140A63A5|nr:hypothetical protein [Streptomyces sp. YIM 98790]